jgi:hypothetical protein
MDPQILQEHVEAYTSDLQIEVTTLIPQSYFYQSSTQIRKSRQRSQYFEIQTEVQNILNGGLLQ